MLDKDEYNEDDVDDYGNDGDHEIEGSSHDIEVGETQTAPSQPQPVAKQDSSIVVHAPLQAFYGIDKSILIDEDQASYENSFMKDTCKHLVDFLLDNSCSEYGVPFRKMTRAISCGTCLIAGITIFVCMATFLYVDNKHYGAWWGALPTFFGACFGIFALNKGCVTIAGIGSLVGLLTCLLGIIYDRTLAAKVDQLMACGSIDVYATDITVLTDTKYYGNDAYYKSCKLCILDNYKNSTDCYCVNGLSECTTFSGRTDCSDILNDYADLANWSVALLAICFCFSFMLSCTACTIVCLLRKDNKFANEFFHLTAKDYERFSNEGQKQLDTFTGEMIHLGQMAGSTMDHALHLHHDDPDKIEHARKSIAASGMKKGQVGGGGVGRPVSTRPGPNQGGTGTSERPVSVKPKKQTNAQTVNPMLLAKAEQEMQQTSHHHHHHGGIQIPGKKAKTIDEKGKSKKNTTGYDNDGTGDSVNSISDVMSNNNVGNVSLDPPSSDSNLGKTENEQQDIGELFKKYDKLMKIGLGEDAAYNRIVQDCVNGEINHSLRDQLIDMLPSKGSGRSAPPLPVGSAGDLVVSGASDNREEAKKAKKAKKEKKEKKAKKEKQ